MILTVTLTLTLTPNPKPLTLIGYLPISGMITDGSKQGSPVKRFRRNPGDSGNSGGDESEGGVTRAEEEVRESKNMSLWL